MSSFRTTYDAVRDVHFLVFADPRPTPKGRILRLV